MLSDFAAVPTLAVSDLQRAREFYEGVLGFASVGDVADDAAGAGSVLPVKPQARPTRSQKNRVRRMGISFLKRAKPGA